MLAMLAHPVFKVQHTKAINLLQWLICSSVIQRYGMNSPNLQYIANVLTAGL